MKRHEQILDRRRTALMIVDVQQRINAVMMDGRRVIDSIVKLIRASEILGLPILITEQYPKGLGPTEPEIVAALPGNTQPLQKMTFSCCGDDAVSSKLKEDDISQLILTGIETHVCVQQTALDLVAQGYQVQLPKDATSSRKALERDTAFERMAAAGVVMTSVESALFELLQVAGTDEFKAISKLIK